MGPLTQDRAIKASKKFRARPSPLKAILTRAAARAFIVTALDLCTISATRQAA
jgi:hypothetical protein